MAAVYTNLSVIAFEPNPANQFYLTRSLLANPSLAKRVALYTVGLQGSQQECPLPCVVCTPHSICH